jgi:bifunctional non-homologous end joining protein LigD
VGLVGRADFCSSYFSARSNRLQGNDLVYMGKVGTGWSRTVSSQIRKQLDTVVSPKSKLTKPIKKPKATWVEPMFVADIEYRDVTSDGLLRQSSFKGLSKGTRRN